MDHFCSMFRDRITDVCSAASVQEKLVERCGQSNSSTALLGGGTTYSMTGQRQHNLPCVGVC